MVLNGLDGMLCAAHCAYRDSMALVGGNGGFPTVPSAVVSGAGDDLSFSVSSLVIFFCRLFCRPVTVVLFVSVIVIVVFFPSEPT